MHLHVFSSVFNLSVVDTVQSLTVPRLWRGSFRVNIVLWRGFQEGGFSDRYLLSFFWYWRVDPSLALVEMESWSTRRTKPKQNKTPRGRGNPKVPRESGSILETRRGFSEPRTRLWVLPLWHSTSKYLTAELLPGGMAGTGGGRISAQICIPHLISAPSNWSRVESFLPSCSLPWTASSSSKFWSQEQCIDLPRAC